MRKREKRNLCAFYAWRLAAICLVVFSAPACDREKQSADRLIEKATEVLLHAEATGDAARFSEAEALLERAGEIETRNDNVYALLGRLYAAQAMLGGPKADPESTLRAEKMFAKALSINPDNTEAIFKQAQLKVSTGEGFDPQVAEQLQRVIELAPEDPRGYRELAFQHLAKTPPDHAQAARLLEKVVDLSPEDFESLVELGICYWRTGRLEIAETTFQKALWMPAPPETHPANPQEYRRRQAKEYLGRIYLERGKYDEAERILKEAADGLEDFNQGHGGYYGCPYQALGMLYSKMGQANKAMEFYVKTADTEAGRVEAQSTAAIQCLIGGDMACALKYADRAMALDAGGIFPALKGYALLLKQHYKEAEKQFQQAESRGANQAAWVGQGHLAIVRKDYVRARELLEKSLGPNGGHEKAEGAFDPFRGAKGFVVEMAYLGLGWLHANQNRHSAAIEQYDRILRDNPNHLLALLGKGNSLAGLKKLEDAEKLFERVIELSPDNPYALAELAIIQYNRGENEAAEKNFQRALAKGDPGYTCPYEGLGLVYLRQGKLDQAKKNFEKAIELNPEIEYKKFNGLAKIKIKEGKLDEAEKLLEKSTENYPYDDEAKALLDELHAARKNAG